VVDAEPRSASVTTLEPCECLLLTQQQLYEAIDEMPNIAVNLLRLLSRRIREANDLSNAEAVEDNRGEIVTPLPHPHPQPYLPNNGNFTDPYGAVPPSPMLPLG
jgi:hypothetical protein